MEAVSEGPLKGFREGFRPLSKEDRGKLEKYELETGQSMEEIEERSAGCIVLTHNSEGSLCVLLNCSSNRGGISYSFPKGHLDEGEDDLAAAIRETEEETGISVPADNIVQDPSQVIEERYSFVTKLHRDKWQRHEAFPDESLRPVVISHKSLVHFVAYIPDGTLIEPRPGDGERHASQWALAEDAKKLLKSSIRPQFKKALTIAKYHIPGFKLMK